MINIRREKSVYGNSIIEELSYDFVDKMKGHVTNIDRKLDKENIRDYLARWEYLKK